MSDKNISRLRRAKKTRMKIKDQDSPRLSVYRSSKNFYAQIFDNLGTKVIASASTVEKDLENSLTIQKVLKLLVKESLKELLKMELRKLYLIDLVINITEE